MTDVDHNPLEPGWASFQSTTLTTYLVCISSFCLWAHYRNRVESLTKINTTNICGSHPLHQVTHCVANNYQIHQALFLLHKFMVITSSDLSALNVLETSRIICPYHLHKDGGEADWSVAPSIFPLVILKGRSEICIIPGLRNLPQTQSSWEQIFWVQIPTGLKGTEGESSSRAQGANMKYLCVSHILCHLHSFIFCWYTCRSSLAALHIPHQIQFHVSFGFPYAIPGCLDDLSVFLQVIYPYFCLLYPSFLSLTFVRNILFIHAGFHSFLFNFPQVRTELLFSLETVITKNKCGPKKRDSPIMLSCKHFLILPIPLRWGPNTDQHKQIKHWAGLLILCFSLVSTALISY